MRLIKIVLASALLAVFCAGFALAQAPEFTPREEWLSLYVRKAKMGYKHIVIRKDVLEGKPVYRRDEYLRVRSGAQLDTRFTLFCDEKYKPIVADYEIIQDGSKTTGEWTFGKDSITIYEKGSDGTMNSQVVEFPIETSSLKESCRFAMGTWPVQVKDWIFQCTGYFRISLVTRADITPAHLMIVGDKKEKITVNGIEYEALVVDHLRGIMRAPDGTPIPVSSGYKGWILENGEIVKELFEYENMDFEEFLRTTREDAMEGIGDVGVRESPYAGASIKSTKYIPDSHEVVELHCKLPDLPKSNVIPDDEIQRTVYDDATRTAEIWIKYKPVDENKAPQIPIKGKEFTKYLTPVPGLQVDQEDIKQLAYSIIGNERNSWRASLLLRRWCFENMPYSLEIDPPLDATSIKDVLIGCCRHYAVLYCALARSVGIPTEMTGGLAYVGSGFGGHAWCESYFGHWATVDATWCYDQGSAVYVKLFNFELPRYYGYGFIASQLIDVIDYKRMKR